MTFDTKADLPEFALLESGEQTHLLRLNENYLIGATLTVREFDDKRLRDTGRLLMFKIASMESGAKHPTVLSARYVILSLSRLGQAPPLS